MILEIVTLEFESSSGQPDALSRHCAFTVGHRAHPNHSKDYAINRRSLVHLYHAGQTDYA